VNIKPGQDTRHTVLLGKCAIKSNKELEDIVKVPGCPPDPAKVVEILTKALIDGSS
jgi:Ni,Fe-hydrogenase I small subunit